MPTIDQVKRFNFNGTLFRLALFTILCLALFAFPAQAFACTPPPGGLPKYTVADHVRAAPIVIEGVVTNTTFLGNTPIHVATIQVARYFKGTGPTTINVDNFGPSSVCLSSVSQGNRFIFYITANSYGYSAFYLSQFDSTAGADPQTIAEVIAAAQNITPTVTPTPSASPNSATATARATLLTPNATMTAQRALDFTATAFASRLASAELTQTSIVITVTSISRTRILTPTPASLFSGQRGLEIGGMLGLGCLVGLLMGVAVGAVAMAILFGRKND